MLGSLTAPGHWLGTDPCKVWQSGHRYYWEGCDCLDGDGTIHNIHAIPADERMDAWLRTLVEWQPITIVGYEVATIEYDNGTWWSDAGCNTLIVTWICEPEV